MSDEPSKCANYLKIVKLLVDVGTNTIRTLFYHFKPRDRVKVFFQSQTICDELAVLKRQNRLSRENYNSLILNPCPEEFDLALLLTLLTNLFKPTIDGPSNGWDKQVAEDDTSLGADLLRLKDIRNKVVGHRPNAELSSDEFEELWKQSECVLIRITEFLDSTKKAEITSKINECKESALDETSERKYMSLLHTWHDEAITLLSHLQDEVDMLCKKAEGFDIFFASMIPERFLRYILLLCEGGLLVLAGIMKRELDKQQTSLSDILLQNKDTLLENNQSAASVIFPTDDSSVVTDISLWGTKQLSHVILMLFHASLTSMERTAVAGIGSASNDYGKVAMESLDSDKFRSCWTDIVLNITILASALDNEIRLETRMLIKKHDTDQVDETVAKQYLMQLRKNCEPLHSLVKQYIDLREELKDAVEKMQKEGACFGQDQVIELKMMTVGKTDEKRELAENILYTLWQMAVNNTGGSTDFATVKAEIDHILQYIKGIRGIKTVDVEKRCIILKIICASCESMLNLLDLFARPFLWRFMTEASHELSSHCKEKVVVTAFITAESMQASLEYLDNEDDCGITSNVRLKFRCSSADAIENVRASLQGIETSNGINRMGQALSDQLSEQLTISTSLVAGGVSDIYSNHLIPISKSPWTEFVLPADTGVQEQVPDVSHLHHLRSILDEIKDSKSRGAQDLDDTNMIKIIGSTIIGASGLDDTNINENKESTITRTSLLDDTYMNENEEPTLTRSSFLDDTNMNENEESTITRTSLLDDTYMNENKESTITRTSLLDDTYMNENKESTITRTSLLDDTKMNEESKTRGASGFTVERDGWVFVEPAGTSKQSTVDIAPFEHQSSNLKHISGPVVNWNDFDIPPRAVRSQCSSFGSVGSGSFDDFDKPPTLMSACSSFGSFVSTASDWSAKSDTFERINTIESDNTLWAHI